MEQPDPKARQVQPSRGPAFEQILERLETIVHNLESGKATLEESLVLFEEGVKLTREGIRALDEAERRIEVQTAEGRRERVPPPQDPGERR